MSLLYQNIHRKKSTHLLHINLLRNYSTTSAIAIHFFTETRVSPAVLCIPLHQCSFPTFTLTEISTLVHRKTSQQLRRCNVVIERKLNMHRTPNLSIHADDKQELFGP